MAWSTRLRLQATEEEPEQAEEPGLSLRRSFCSSPRRSSLTIARAHAPRRWSNSTRSKVSVRSGARCSGRLQASPPVLWSSRSVLAPTVHAAGRCARAGFSVSERHGDDPGGACAAPLPSPQQMAADYENALRLLELDAAQEAATRLQRLADAGFPMAQHRLAKLYESGTGVAADLVQARQWTERAANAGNRQAIHDLGVYYARGEGAPRDEAAAFRLFEQAAELDLADSQFNLGVLYEQGRGVEANPREALFWYMLAARQGDEAADERVAALGLQLPAYDVEQATARVAAFEPTPADPIANGMFAPSPADAPENPESAAVQGAEGSPVPATEG